MFSRTMADARLVWFGLVEGAGHTKEIGVNVSCCHRPCLSVSEVPFLVLFPSVVRFFFGLNGTIVELICSDVLLILREGEKPATLAL